MIRKSLRAGHGNRRHFEAGLTLLETMIAAFIFLIVLLAMITAYTLSRINLDREEVKRRATALGRDRLEQLRRRTVYGGGWNTLTPATPDTSYLIDGTTFTLNRAVVDSPSVGSSVRKIVTITVNWTAYRNNGPPVARNITATTIFARDVTPE